MRGRYRVNIQVDLDHGINLIKIIPFITIKSNQKLLRTHLFGAILHYSIRLALSVLQLQQYKIYGII